MREKVELNFQPAAQALKNAASVLLVSHEFTDGDDLGAMLALHFVLSEWGKSHAMVARGGVPDNLLFLPDSQYVKDSLPAEDYEAFVFLGCGTSARPGFPGWNLTSKNILNIDHHIDNQFFGQINLVDPQAAATSEIVYNFLKYLTVKITKAMAVNLLTGIFNDTGGFRHANTTAQVLEIAAELMRKGARIDRIAEYYFGRTELSKLRAWARALENARFDPEKQMMYSIVTEEELQEIGAKPEDLDGVVSVLNTIPEAKFALLLKQRGDEIKGSLRSETYKGVDVAEVARKFGGGGHKLSAGFKLKGKIEKTPEGWRIT